MFKFWCYLGQLSSLTANISGMHRDIARSVYASAFECGPRDFAIGGISPPPEFSFSRTYGAGWTHVGLCSKFLVCSLKN